MERERSFTQELKARFKWRSAEGPEAATRPAESYDSDLASRIHRRRPGPCYGESLEEQRDEVGASSISYSLQELAYREDTARQNHGSRVGKAERRRGERR
jgi:hypothetical protein